MNQPRVAAKSRPWCDGDGPAGTSSGVLPPQWGVAASSFEVHKTSRSAVIAVKRHFGTPWHSVVVIVCKNLGTSMINLTPEGDGHGSTLLLESPPPLLDSPATTAAQRGTGVRNGRWRDGFREPLVKRPNMSDAGWLDVRAPSPLACGPMSISPEVPRLAPASQRACYLPWLKVSVALRYVRTFPWAPEAWREVRQHVPWLLAEEFRLRKAGWFN